MASCVGGCFRWACAWQCQGALGSDREHTTRDRDCVSAEGRGSAPSGPTPPWLAGESDVVPSRGKETFRLWASVSKELHGCLEKIPSKKGPRPPCGDEQYFLHQNAPLGIQLRVSLPLVNDVVERLPGRNGKSTPEEWVTLSHYKDFIRQREVTCERVGKGGLWCWEGLKTV